LFDALGGLLCSVAGDLLSKFHDDAVVDDAVNGDGGHGVFEYLLPQVRRDDDAAAFVALSQEGEEHFHLVAGLLNVADIVEDDHFVGIKAAQLALKQQVTLCPQEFVHQVKGGGE